MDIALASSIRKARKISNARIKKNKWNVDN